MIYLYTITNFYIIKLIFIKILYEYLYMDEINNKLESVKINPFDKFISDDIHYLSLKFIGQSKTIISPHHTIINKIKPYIETVGISDINKNMFRLLNKKITDDYKINLNDDQNHYLQSMIDSYLKITLNKL